MEKDLFALGAEIDGIAAMLTIVSNLFLEHEIPDENIVGEALNGAAMHARRVSADVFRIQEENDLRCVEEVSA